LPQEADRVSAGEPLGELRRALAKAQCVAALTGAGISAESGVATFRGQSDARALWRNYRPEQLATPEAFERDPRLVWEWYDWRRGCVERAGPNAGHRALAELERRFVESGRRFTLITQNVDGLHDRAGSRQIAKLHGDLWTLRCLGCGREGRDERVPLDPLPPRCACGGLLRPGVVWFGELLPAGEWARAAEASATARVFLVIGTSGVVYPAAGLVEVARQTGAKIAVVNPEPTPLDTGADWVFRGTAGEILARLL
jgi:NAD-dependent deacetylase